MGIPPTFVRMVKVFYNDTIKVRAFYLPGHPMEREVEGDLK